MKAINVDILNTFLIILSLVLAFIMPFELFLLAYAILGPLHYLTEIQWIRGKNYFVQNKSWVYLIIAFALLFSVPVIFTLPFFDYFDGTFFQFIKYRIRPHLNGLLFLGLVVALALVVFKKAKWQMVAIFLGILIGVIFNRYPNYQLIMGVFLPTIIHVFVFTVLFMLYGNLKKQSRVGYINVLLMIIVPLFIFNLAIPITSYNFSAQTKEVFTENQLYSIATSLSKFFGITDGKQFFFYDPLMIKLQIFISFAYTYHYLNWFSKTTVIGWHKQLTKKRSLIILLVWMISVSLYLYNYRTGLALLLFLSLLHVFMEFPLNVLSVKGIGQFVYDKLKRTT